MVKELGAQNWRAWALGMCSNTFSWIFDHFAFFQDFFAPEPQMSTKIVLPDERRDITKMLMNFWLGVEKISKKHKMIKNP